MTIRKLLPCLTVVVAVVAVLSACTQIQPTVLTPQTAEPDTGAIIPADLSVGDAVSLPLSTVRIVDRAIARKRAGIVIAGAAAKPGVVRKIIVQSVHARRIPTGDVELIMRAANLTDHPQQVEARTHFTTADGVEAEPLAAWTRLHIAPQSTATYTTTSTVGASAQRALIELRGGK